MSSAAGGCRAAAIPAKVMASAVYLAEHLAEVRHRRPDHHRQARWQRPAGLFDSVIQAAWSFCLALRARGLGTTWVTAALQDTAGSRRSLASPST